MDLSPEERGILVQVAAKCAGEQQRLDMGDETDLYLFFQERVFDFFLLSPNIHITDIATTDLKFRHSDHNPVKLSFVLMPNQ